MQKRKFKSEIIITVLLAQGCVFQIDHGQTK